MPARSIKVWNSTSSEWEDVAVASPDTSSFVQNSLIQGSKGSLPVGTGSAVAALSPGSNGQSLVADSSQTNGLRYIDGQTARNAVINGSCTVAQRGTASVTISAAEFRYPVDRWKVALANAATAATSQQISSISLDGFRNAVRVQRTSGNSATHEIYLLNNFETIDSIPFQGKTITLSFWARAGSNYSPTSSALAARVYSGTGTDQSAYGFNFTGTATPINGTATLTTSWQRFTFSGTIASSATQLQVLFAMAPTGTASTSDFFDVTGIQVEASPVATPFEFEPFEATLRKCQRYYQRYISDVAYGMLGEGKAYSTSVVQIRMHHTVPMRAVPTAIDTSAASQFYLETGASSQAAITSLAMSGTLTNRRSTVVEFTKSASFTTGAYYHLYSNNDANCFIGITAEL